MKLSPPLQQVDRTYVLLEGRKFSYFAGCDYLRLASHPQILRAVTDGLKQYGLNTAASRFTTGNHQLHENLERELARFFDSETASLASNGYLPNLIAAQALAGQFSHALIDERAHGSLVDAAQLLDCPMVQFKHRDTADLGALLERLGKIKPLVMTDGIFSQDGEIAPIKEYLKRLPAGGMILLDDAHGAATLGKTGKGTMEYAGVSSPRIIQTITLGKAFGVYGGAVLGSRKLREAILKHSHIFVGNTPLPLPLANAAIESLRLVRKDVQLQSRLLANVARVKKSFRANGLAVADNPSPIVSLVPKTKAIAERLRKRLLAAKIHPPLIHYSGAPAGGYFRFAISSEHSSAQLDQLLEAIANC